MATESHSPLFIDNIAELKRAAHAAAALRGPVRKRMIDAGFEFFGDVRKIVQEAVFDNSQSDQRKFEEMIIAQLMPHSVSVRALMRGVLDTNEPVCRIDADTILFPQGDAGGCGLVYLGFRRNSRDSCTPLVAKVLAIPPGNPQAYKEMVERMVQEREILTALGGIVTPEIIGYGDWDGNPYYLMKYIRGSTLHSLRYSLNPGEMMHPQLVRNIGLCICLGLSDIHTKGVVHRDITPSNIMLEEDTGAVKIIDFGLASKAMHLKQNDASRRTAQGRGLGTPAYMAPEQHNAARDATEHSDIYGAGVTLYELLTGKLPYEGNRIDDAAMAEKKKKNVADYSDIDDVDPALGAILKMMMDGEPFRRPNAIKGAELFCKNSAEFDAIRNADPRSWTIFFPGNASETLPAAGDNPQLRSRFRNPRDMYDSTIRHMGLSPVMRMPIQRTHHRLHYVLAGTLGLSAAGLAAVGAYHLSSKPSAVQKKENDSPDIQHRSASLQLTLDPQESFKEARLFPEEPNCVTLPYHEGIHAFNNRKEWKRSLFFLAEERTRQLLDMSKNTMLPEDLRGEIPLLIVSEKIDGKRQCFLYMGNGGLVFTTSGKPDIFYPTNDADERLNFGRGAQRRGMMTMETMERDPELRRFLIHSSAGGELSMQQGNAFQVPPGRKEGFAPMFLEKQYDIFREKGLNFRPEGK